MNRKPRLLSLFSGCGGLDLGFVQAGYKVSWANDFDHWSCKTYERNFGKHIFEGDVSEVNFSKVPDCDIITGGFPCQDFSMIWKRGGLKTDRGNLYKHLVRAVEEKQPKAFIGENVKGILTANRGTAIKQIASDFAKRGYGVKVHLVNFADYGVPQVRQRVLIVGIRRDVDFDFQIPSPTHQPDSYISAGSALAGAEKAKYNNERMNIQERTKKVLSLIPEGGNFSSIPKSSPYYVKGMISHVYRRLDRKKPSTTIIAGGGGGTWGYHFKDNRPLTNRERARLFGYPDSFVFEGSVAEVRRQIGNSVPPPAAKVFATWLKPIFSKGFVANQKHSQAISQIATQKA